MKCIVDCFKYVEPQKINMWWWFLSCSEGLQDSAQQSFTLHSPKITEVEWVCEDDLWTILVTTEGWTGNGTLWLGTTERYERHPLYSIQAAPDGSADLLRIRLEATPDWRDAQAGQRTGFQCVEQTRISGMLMVLDPSSLDPADCYTWVGEETSFDEIWAEVPLPECPE
jgi:hypothetical protein